MGAGLLWDGAALELARRELGGARELGSGANREAWWQTEGRQPSHGAPDADGVVSCHSVGEGGLWEYLISDTIALEQKRCTCTGVISVPKIHEHP